MGADALARRYQRGRVRTRPHEGWNRRRSLLRRVICVLFNRQRQSAIVGLARIEVRVCDEVASGDIPLRTRPERTVVRRPFDGGEYLFYSTDVLCSNTSGECDLGLMRVAEIAERGVDVDATR